MILEAKLWKVGELANKTGLTVRTLHHYDEIGLFSPSRYSDAGHRLYTKEDIGRLQQIVSLRQFGFSLDQIKEIVEGQEFDPAETIRVHLDGLHDKIRKMEELRNQMERLLDLLGKEQDLTSEQLIEIIEVMKMSEKYFTPEQMAKIKQQGEKLGPDKIKEVENEWPVLIEKVRAEMENGTPPENPEVIRLARRWKELVSLFTGGDDGITKAAEHYYQENPDMAEQSGIDRELYEYIQKAFPQA